MEVIDVRVGDDIAFQLTVFESFRGTILSNSEDLTGMMVWPATRLFCDFAESEFGRQIFREKRIIEFGSGLGLSGIVASHLAAFCCCTDREDSVLEVLRKNTASFANCQVGRLTWGESEDEDALLQQCGERGFDLVLGCDVVYPGMGEDVLTALFSSAKRLLQGKEQQQQILISYIPRKRETDILLAEVAKRMGYLWRNVTEFCKKKETANNSVADSGFLILFESSGEEDQKAEEAFWISAPPKKRGGDDGSDSDSEKEWGGPAQGGLFDSDLEDEDP